MGFHKNAEIKVIKKNASLSDEKDVYMSVDDIEEMDSYQLDEPKHSTLDEDELVEK